MNQNVSQFGYFFSQSIFQQMGYVVTFLHRNVGVNNGANQRGISFRLFG